MNDLDREFIETKRVKCKGDKIREAKEIETQTAEFLARGGKIKSESLDASEYEYNWRTSNGSKFT